MSDDEPEPRFSKPDLFGFALMIALGGSFLGHWYANDNSHLLRDYPLIVVWHGLFIGFPFFLLALGGTRNWRAWATFGVISLVFWGAIFWFMSVFTT
jgi:hypothetical protein